MLFLARPFQDTDVWDESMESRSVFQPLLFHRWSAQTTTLVLMLSDDLMSCCVAGTNGCLNLRCCAFPLERHVNAGERMSRFCWTTMTPQVLSQPHLSSIGCSTAFKLHALLIRLHRSKQHQLEIDLYMYILILGVFLDSFGEYNQTYSAMYLDNCNCWFVILSSIKINQPFGNWCNSCQS